MKIEYFNRSNSNDPQNKVKPKFTDVCNKYFKRIMNVKTEGWILSAIEENEDEPK
jgi:hypothetical protein